jgi:hypothetical protein
MLVRKHQQFPAEREVEQRLAVLSANPPKVRGIPLDLPIEFRAVDRDPVCVLERVDEVRLADEGLREEEGDALDEIGGGLKN